MDWMLAGLLIWIAAMLAFVAGYVTAGIVGTSARADDSEARAMLEREIVRLTRLLERYDTK